jgi:hypothetical protein
MAYVAPPIFSHGDYPTAANLNILGDDIVVIAAGLDNVNWAAAEIPADGATMINAYRWLHYQTIPDETGTIIDPSGIGANQSLPNSTSSIVAFDLSDVPWLLPSRLYKLTGCKYALEDWSP